MSTALFVFADGRTESVDGACAHFVQRDERWFRLAGVATDKNTVYDGMQIEGSDGPPNKGRAVYTEIPEPPFSTSVVLRL